MAIQCSFRKSTQSKAQTAASSAAFRALVAAVSTAALLLPNTPLPPARPTAFALDGVRDPGYVLVAEDPSGDLADSIASQPRYLWADLTRLYVATDDDNLYVYADLPNYLPSSASGQIGLALLLPNGTTNGPLADYLRPQHIAYAFNGSAAGQCAGSSITPARHPDFLIRGFIRGMSSDAENPNLELHYLAASDEGAWEGTDDFWSGSSSLGLNEHVAYGDAKGVELHIPWSDLNLNAPVELGVSFITTGGGPGSAADAAPGVFDSIPNDPQAPPALTSTVLSQLQTVTFPLPTPASVSLGCGTASVNEDAGPATLSAQLYTVPTSTVALSYTTTALTAGPADYTPITGTVTFSPGATRQTISIPITNDSLDEPNETFRVTLTNPAGLTLVTPISTTVTIVDNDEAVAYKVFVPVVRRR